MTLKRTKPLARTAIQPKGPSGFLRRKTRDAQLGHKGMKTERPMKHGKVAPNAEEKRWMEAVAKLGCIVCRMQGRGFVPAAVHHIVEGNRRVGHMFTIPLCDPGHHQNSPDPSQVSRHPYKTRFEDAYGTEYELLDKVRELLR